MSYPAAPQPPEDTGRCRSRIAKIVAFAAPLIIAAVGMLLSQQVRTTNALRASERAVFEQRTVLQAFLSAHQDIETGSRGYVISGKETYLEPYYLGTHELEDLWPQLRGRFLVDREESSLIDELDRLSFDKRENSLRSITLRRSGDEAGAIANVETGRGKAIMDQIRTDVAELIARQQARLATTSAQSEEAIDDLRTMMFFLLGLLTFLLVVAWIALQRLLQLRAETLSAVEDLSRRRKAILDGATDSIITLNPSGSIESANAAMLRMFGYTEDDLRNRDARLLYADPPPIGAVAERLQSIAPEQDGEAHPQEFRAKRKDGSELVCEAAISTMRLHEGTRYVAVIRDVTERKRVEQLKSEFVSTVSHELRTPLTSIAGALGLLSSGVAGAFDTRAERLISIAHTNAERLVRLINDILDIEKIESGKMPFNNRELDLKAAVAASIEENRSYAARFDVRIALSAPMTPMRVLADRDRLAQVLSNLLSNAAKYSPKGGTIDVSISRNGACYRVTVADQGPGIPEGFRSRIFGKFAQADASDSRERGGTGLGLSIVSEIVQRLGGEISFESEPDKGARFHVDLPTLGEASHSSDVRALLVCGNGAGSSFSEVLRKAGYAVTFVKDRDDMRTVLATRRFDGIVVDMGLREGNGIDAIRAVREDRLNQRTPVLALGGRSAASGLEGDAALVIDWLRKPIEVERLVGSLGVSREMASRDTPRVLHVEDDPDVIRLVTEALAGRADVIAASSVAAARQALRTGSFDLAIVDLGLTDGSGVEILPELARPPGQPPVPVIIFSAQDADPETAGLVDAYLTKARTPIASLVALVESLMTIQHTAASQQEQSTASRKGKAAKGARA